MPRITTSETTKAVVSDLERLAKINRRSAPMQALIAIENELGLNRARLLRGDKLPGRAAK